MASQETDQIDRSDHPEPMSFDVSCPCGLRFRGRGRSPGQPLFCPHCGTPMLERGQARAGAMRVRLNLRESLRTLRSIIARKIVRGATRLAAQLRSQLTLARVLIVLVVLLTAGTLWWSWLANLRRSALATLETATRAGTNALDEGRFDEAARQLAKAATAARTIGVTHPPARRAIQLDREARVWWRLSTSSLDQFFAGAAFRDPDRLIDAFNDAFAERSMIFDGHLSLDTADSAHGAAGRLRFDWALLQDGEQIELEIPPGSPLRISGGAEPERIIFGAVIQGLARPSPPVSRWLVRMKPETITLLTAAAPLRLWHWPDEASWLPVLEQQRARLDRG